MTTETRSTDGKTLTFTDENGMITDTFQTLDSITLKLHGRKSKFTKEIHTRKNDKGETVQEMYLIGGRGARYVLNAWNSSHPADKALNGGLYYASSFTGGIMKKQGNTVIFFMIGGEVGFHRYA